VTVLIGSSLQGLFFKHPQKKRLPPVFLLFLKCVHEVLKKKY